MSRQMAILWTLLALGCFPTISRATETSERPQTPDDELTNCVTNCRDDDLTSFRNASLICRYMGDGHKPRVMPPCYHGCYHATVPDEESQKQCFCKLCQEMYGFGFCRTGERDINPEDCDSLVCSGDHPDVKFRGHICRQN